jgi:ATP-binding cassette subfamily B protein
VLALVDPIIFGWLVDDYANQRNVKSDEELVRGALRLLALAVAWRSPRAPARRCRTT